MRPRRPNNPPNRRAPGRARPLGTTAIFTRPARRPLSPEIAARLDHDPAFQVMTADGGQWIDPYTGQAVPASLGRLPAAREYLIESGVWIERQPMPLDQVLCERWRVDLLRLIPTEPRLRMFLREGGGWINPYNGQVVSGIEREEGRLTSRTVVAMARHLATCLEAQPGVLLDQATLVQRAQSAGQLSSSTRSVPVARPATDGFSQNGASAAIGEGMAGELARARDVQDHMLPDLPEVDGFDLAVHYSAHSGVSGDFYEVLPLPGGCFALLLGDVSGHGMQAALVVASALKTLRFIARGESDLPRLLSRFNDEIKPDLMPGQFITLTAALIDPRTRTLTCVRAGHHHTLVVNPDNPLPLRKVGRKGMAIGIATGETFARTLQPETFDLQHGDVVLQYTDGLTEAMSAPAAGTAGDARADEFGDCRLFASIFRHFELELQAFLDAIARDVRVHAGGAVGDDLSIIAIHVLPAADDEAPA